MLKVSAVAQVPNGRSASRFAVRETLAIEQFRLDVGATGRIAIRRQRQRRRARL
jgi:hypothetical protein